MQVRFNIWTAALLSLSFVTALSAQAQWTYPPKPAVGSVQPATAEPLVTRPRSKPCTVTLFTDDQFTPSNGSPAQPYTYRPSSKCRGPWAKVVLEADLSADNNPNTYDQTAKIFLNGVAIYYGSTVVPYQNFAPAWHEERDVTDYAALFLQEQTGEAYIDNNSSQDGDPAGNHSAIHMTAKLVFYPASFSEPAPATADEVMSLDPGASEAAMLFTDTDQLSRTFTLPRNIEKVYLDIFRQNQIGDEVYWTTSTPFRQVEISIDGKPAGVAPAYPYIYTATNPGVGGVFYMNWAPIPAVQALNFIPYRVDLTPFAGTLSDGYRHTVAVNMYGMQDTGTDPTSSAYFDVTGTLLLFRDHGRQQVQGELTKNTLTAVPTVTTDPTTGEVTSDSNFTIAGWVETSHGRVETTVQQKFAYSDLFTESVSDQLTQRTSVDSDTTVRSGFITDETLQHLSYPIDGEYILNSDYNLLSASFKQGYKEQTTRQLNGRTVDDSAVSDLYTTGNFGTVSHQKYSSHDSRGNCYSRKLTAQIATNPTSITRVKDGKDCPSR